MWINILDYALKITQLMKSFKIFSKFLKNSLKIPLKLLLGYQLMYIYPIDQQITRRSTILIATSRRCRIAKRQTTTSWFCCYKTICNQVVSSLPCLELFLQRWIRRGMRKKEKKKEDAATEGWKRDYGRIIGFASYGSLLEKVQAKLSPRHVAATVQKARRTSTLISRSFLRARPTRFLICFFSSLFFSFRSRYIFIALRLSAFSMQFRRKP